MVVMKMAYRPFSTVQIQNSKAKAIAIDLFFAERFLFFLLTHRMLCPWLSAIELPRSEFIGGASRIMKNFSYIEYICSLYSLFNQPIDNMNNRISAILRA